MTQVTDPHDTLVDKLEERDAKTRNRVAALTWGSVLVASAIVLVLIAVSHRELQRVRGDVSQAQADLAEVNKKRRSAANELKNAEAQRDAAKAERDVAEKERNAAKAERDTAKAQSSIYHSIVQQVPEPVLRRADIATSAAIAPRIYPQIVREQDRAYATRIGNALSAAGFVVLGMSVEKGAAKGLKQTEVRFYKQADHEEADRVAEALRAAGVDSVKVVDLKMDNNTHVRPRHYEVWFPAQPGQ